MKTFEFAVEVGWQFAYIEVEATDAQTARRLLWDEVLTDVQKNVVSDIELVTEREAAGAQQ